MALDPVTDAVNDGLDGVLERSVDDDGIGVEYDAGGTNGGRQAPRRPGSDIVQLIRRSTA